MEITPQRKQELLDLMQKRNDEAVKAVAEMQKSPVSWEKISKQVNEAFIAHNQVNPNKR